MKNDKVLYKERERERKSAKEDYVEESKENAGELVVLPGCLPEKYEKKTYFYNVDR